MIKVAPSILSADFANLAKDIQDVEAGGLIIFMSMSWTGTLSRILRLDRSSLRPFVQSPSFLWTSI